MEKPIRVEIVAQVGTVGCLEIVENMTMMTLQQTQCVVHAKVFVLFTL